jgi:hypothetical protein
MISEKRILAARANGARSRGPKTPEGKARSSRNALRHGLLAKCVVLGSESRESFKALFDLHVERFSPVDDVELGMIEEMAASYWRLRRAWAMENRLLDEAMSKRPEERELSRIAAAFAELAGTPQLGLLHRYETRLHVMYQRALHNLVLLRSAAVRNEPKNSCVSITELEIQPAELPPAHAS